MPKEASRLVFGLILKDEGDVTASQVSRVTGEPVVEVPLSKVLDQAISLVRAHALPGAELDWSVVEPQMRSMAADALVARDVYPAIRDLLKRLNDHHSFLMDRAHAAAEASSVTLSTEPLVALHGGGVGYVNVSGYTGLDPHARNVLVTCMVDAIAGSAPDVRCGWIVDLCQNTGGSMVPMLGGLRPLLGNTLGIGLCDAHGKVEMRPVGHGLDCIRPARSGPFKKSGCRTYRAQNGELPVKWLRWPFAGVRTRARSVVRRTACVPVTPLIHGQTAASWANHVG